MTHPLAVLQSPARYAQGREATKQLGAELSQIGITGPVLILSSEAPHRLLSSTWTSTMGRANIEFSVEIFSGECSPAEISRVTSAARSAKANAIIGVGGGKTLDTSRAVADALNVAAVNCPTVASSDAPCSALSVLYTDQDEFLEYRFYKSNPQLVLVDSTVIAQAPTRLLVSGIGDALATWWEADTVRRSGAQNQLHGQPTKTGTALAQLCYQLLKENAVAAVAASDIDSVTPALENIIEANTLLSGLGFESGGLAAAHSVHNGLTTQPETRDFLHGEKVSFGLVTQFVLEDRSSKDFHEVLELSHSVGLPITLTQVGLKEPSPDQIRQIADRTVATGETIHHEPFRVTAVDVADAIRAADAIGRDWIASSALTGR